MIYGEVDFEVPSSKCSIGIFLNDACNKRTWTNHIGVFPIGDLPHIDLKLTELRIRAS